MFELHPRLAEDSAFVDLLPLSQIRLMNDSRFAWLLLVPAKPELREIHDLAPPDRTQLMAEISQASEALARLFAPDKINVGALGNLVPQLHVHVIARRKDDDAWPGPVWGQGTAVLYEAEVLNQMIARIRGALGGA